MWNYTGSTWKPPSHGSDLLYTSRGTTKTFQVYTIALFSITPRGTISSGIKIIVQTTWFWKFLSLWSSWFKSYMYPRHRSNFIEFGVFEFYYYERILGEAIQNLREFNNFHPLFGLFHVLTMVTEWVDNRSEYLDFWMIWVAVFSLMLKMIILSWPSNFVN